MRSLRTQPAFSTRPPVKGRSINSQPAAAASHWVLNEFLKEHRKVEEQEATVRQLSSVVAEQQKVFTARLKEQDSKIQAVNERLEVSGPAPQMVANNQ
jgi:uncharacterized coiled-coil protein SlyX